MKVIALLFSFLYSFMICFAQGHIRAENGNPKAGKETRYYYLPPQGLLLPPKMQVLVAYETNNAFFKQAIPITKIGNRYSFTFKAPDSTAVLIFSVVNEKKKVLRSNVFFVEKEIVVDNNREEGFVIYLHDRKGVRFTYSGISLANMSSDFAIHALQLKQVPNRNIINLYEATYKLHSSLRQGDSYTDYLIALYKEDTNMRKTQLLANAKQLCAINNNETKLLKAVKIYGILKMDTLQKEIKKRILIEYPGGRLARNFFLDSLYDEKGKTEKSVLAALNEYVKHFKDSTPILKDKFYKLIVSILLSKKEFHILPVYEKLIQNKFIVINMFNYHAWKLAGKGLDNPGSELEDAKSLSKKSIGLIDSLIKNGEKIDDNGDDIYAIRDMNINTYALILYKLGQYDSAFNYQFSIYKNGKELLDDEGYERLAAYMEKSQGIVRTKKFIEDQLLKGLNSPRVLNQLQSIYKQLNLSFNEFNQLQNENNRLVKIRNIESIKEKMESIIAKDFLLKNLSGEEVSLQSYRNKIVVLDFWATWCAPCKASFPEMQKLVNKYKTDPEVVFLFIDVWESKESLELKEIVVNYMKENSYTFNVLFDENKKVVKDYKVEAIPQKFIIDKNGEIVFISDINYLDDISVAIEAAKK